MRLPEEVAAMLRLRDLGWGTRRIAAELGCTRETVQRYLTAGGWAPYRTPERPGALDGHGVWLAERLRRHAGNADVVRQELVAELGIVVSLRTVERAVASLRRELAAEALATVRFETPPGRQLQIDFGERWVLIGAERVRVYLFVATLGSSRRVYARAFRHERQSAWFEGLEGAFRHFGGRPRELLLDNAKALVEHHDPATREVRFNARLHAFARYWDVQPVACAPYRARTTDEVEQSLLRDLVLFSACPWVTAWQRAGREVRARPRRLRAAPPLRRPWAPLVRAGSSPRSAAGRPFRPARPDAVPRVGFGSGCRHRPSRAGRGGPAARSAARGRAASWRAMPGAPRRSPRRVGEDARR
jgi:transposase